MSPLAILILSMYILLPCINLAVALKGRPTRSRMLVVLFIAVTLLHNAGYFIEATAQSIDVVFVAAQFEFLFGNLSLLVFFYFLYDWCQSKLPRWFHIVFLLLGGIAAMMAITSGSHNLFFGVKSIIRAGEEVRFTQVELVYYPFEYVMYMIYLITYVIMGVMLTRAYKRTEDQNSRRVLILFAAAGLSPMICELLYAVGVITGIDPTPTGYFLSQSVLAWCLAREKVFDVLRDAFDVIAKRMDGALIVADDQEKLLFSNDAANERLPGLRVSQSLPDPIRYLFDEDKQDAEIQLADGIYQSRITVLTDGSVVRGKVVLLSDVSHLHKLKEMLEQENRRITSDLELAATIQANALPRVFPPWPERTDFEIYATMRPAKEVGGDFYDFFLVDENHLACVIADVSGKGVPAALFMMNAKACIRDRMMAGMPPDQAFAAANDQLCTGNDAGMFITAWAALIDLRTGDTCFVNAGHNPPWLLKGGTEWTTLKTRPNMVLADDFGVDYVPHQYHLSEGDVLYLYTDGVVEAQDAASTLYGDQRLMEVLKKSISAPPQALLQNVQEDVDRFVGDAPQFDDITMLALRINSLIQTLTVPAVLASCEKVTTFIEEWLTKRGCDSRTMYHLLVAQDEIFSNIARYAYADSPDGGEATVELGNQGKMITLRFIDSGIPFNPLDITRKRRAYADEWEEGGDGIFMVKKLMDHVSYEYRDGQNHFTMQKTIAITNGCEDS